MAARKKSHDIGWLMRQRYMSEGMGRPRKKNRKGGIEMEHLNMSLGH